jgi:hypothetical protein
VGFALWRPPRPRKPDGGTGRHNMVRAANKKAQSGWDPGRVNSIAAMTDGKTVRTKTLRA